MTSKGCSIPTEAVVMHEHEGILYPITLYLVYYEATCVAMSREMQTYCKLFLPRAACRAPTSYQIII